MKNTTAINWGKVKAQDENLRKAGEHLAKLRWENTLGATPPVSFAEYAKQVGVHRSSVGKYATAHQMLLASNTSGVSLTFENALNRATHSEERAEVVEAVAEARGITPATARGGHIDAVRRIESRARELASENDTTVKEEAEKLARTEATESKQRTPSAGSSNPENWSDEQWERFDAKVAAAAEATILALTLWERGLYTPGILASAFLSLLKQSDLDAELAELLSSGTR